MADAGALLKDRYLTLRRTLAATLKVHAEERAAAFDRLRGAEARLAEASQLGALAAKLWAQTAAQGDAVAGQAAADRATLRGTPRPGAWRQPSPGTCSGEVTTPATATRGTGVALFSPGSSKRGAATPTTTAAADAEHEQRHRAVEARIEEARARRAAHLSAGKRHAPIGR